VEWLKAASVNESVEEIHKDFFANLSGKIHGSFKKLEQNCLKENKDLKTEEDITKMFTFESSILLECDKGFGLSMIPIEALIKADSDIMAKMKAEKISDSEEECMKRVSEQIAAFEEGLTNKQKAILDNLVSEREATRHQCQLLPTGHNRTGPVRVEKGGMAELFCKVDAKPAVNSVRWTREGRFIAQKKLRKGNATITVIVRHAPGTAAITPDEPIGLEGEAVRLECGADPPGYPEPTYGGGGKARSLSYINFICQVDHRAEDCCGLGTEITK